MPKKKKIQGNKKRDAAEGAAGEKSSGKEKLLQEEYEMLSDTLNHLKRRAEQIRRENKFLHQEASRTQQESEEYTTYMTSRTQKLQEAIAAESELHQKDLEKLRKEREESLEKHKHQTNELRKKILEKEKELALLNAEIDGLKEFKMLKQQQEARIAEMEEEVAELHRRHCQDLLELKANLLSEKQKHEGQAKQKVQTLSRAANREISRSLRAHVQQVVEDNRHLQAELERLMQREHALRLRKARLEEQREELLLEREFTQQLGRMRLSALSPGNSCKNINPLLQ